MFPSIGFPLASLPREDVDGLTRARGDGPAPRSHPGIGVGAHPRARGRTSGRVFHRASGYGSPARAGTDPFLAAPDEAVLGLTRARGDGPRRACACRGSRAAHPRARGRTSTRTRDGFRVGGSPARAGTDRGEAQHPRREGGLTRARGDGPRTTASQGPPAQAHPRTRGRPTKGVSGARQGSGSPERAGTDLALAVGHREEPRLTRARGRTLASWTLIDSKPSSPARGDGPAAWMRALFTVKAHPCGDGPGSRGGRGG